ncbi:MAG: KilA-N domain-containing protein [Nanobdellota archaeon]
MSHYLHNEEEYISLTDIAKQKNSEEPRFVVINWLRNRNTIEFLGIWEKINNPDFNRVGFDTVRMQTGVNSFTISPSKWIEITNICFFRNLFLLF